MYMYCLHVLAHDGGHPPLQYSVVSPGNEDISVDVRLGEVGQSVVEVSNLLPSRVYRIEILARNQRQNGTNSANGKLSVRVVTRGEFLLFMT